MDNDHDQITAFSGRGLFSESKGPVWLVGTGEQRDMKSILGWDSHLCVIKHQGCNVVLIWLDVGRVSLTYKLFSYLAEHHVLYQFNLVNAEDHYMGLIQTETV